MNFINSIILGVTQGVTEFLPISSSAHLIFMQHFLEIEHSQIFFDVLLHFSTALVIAIFYRKEIWNILKNLKNYKKFKSNSWARLFWLIIIASLPTAMIGFFLKDYFERVFNNIFLVAVFLLVTGFLIWWVEKFSKTERKIDFLNATAGHALFIGFMQGIAILPGISRSGATIVAALLCGWKREEAVVFSFLVSLPAILGANFIQMKDLEFSGQNIFFAQCLLGMSFAFVFGWLSLKFLVKMLRIKKLIWFSYYCWALGLTVCIGSLIN